LTALALEVAVEPASSASWESPILFDSAVRDALRIGSASGRETAKNISDALMFVSIAHPLVDNFLVTWYLRRAPRVAWQMFVINAQAYSLTLALNTLSKRLTSRARPWVEGCAENEPELCGSGESYRAFYSGHAAITATGAGLICAHHTQLSLYQNDVLDAGACVTAVLGTAVTGAMRIASDNHWASDVVVGHLAGYLSGYLLPTLLYYREFRLTPEPAPEGTGPVFAVVPLPWIDGESLQLRLMGIF
jgi:membrane-associated phospholipid phosphatase